MSNKIKISRFLEAVMICTFVAFSGCGEMTGDSGGEIKSAGSDITEPTATTGTNGTTSGGSSPYKGTLSITAGSTTLSGLTIDSNGNISGNSTYGSCSGTVSTSGKLTMTCTSSTAGTLSITNGQLAISGSSITGSGTATLTNTSGSTTTSDLTATGTATATTTTGGTTGTTTGTTTGAGSCTISMSGSGVCANYIGSGWTASIVSSNCVADAPATATYSSSACTTSGAVGKCSTGEGQFTMEHYYSYSDFLVDGLSSGCSQSGGVWTAL